MCGAMYLIFLNVASFEIKLPSNPRVQGHETMSLKNPLLGLEPENTQEFQPVVVVNSSLLVRKPMVLVFIRLLLTLFHEHPKFMYIFKEEKDSKTYWPWLLIRSPLVWIVDLNMEFLPSKFMWVFCFAIKNIVLMKSHSNFDFCWGGLFVFSRAAMIRGIIFEL